MTPSSSDDILDLVQPHLRDVPPYVPVEPPDGGREAPGYRRRSASSSSTPTRTPTARRRAWPRRWPVPTRCTSTRTRSSAGSARLSAATSASAPTTSSAAPARDELIDLLIRMFVPPGDALLNFPPTFSFYPFLAAIQDAFVVNIERREDFSIDIDEALRHASGVGLIVTTSPNNPSGTLLPREDLAGPARDRQARDRGRGLRRVLRRDLHRPHPGAREPHRAADPEQVGRARRSASRLHGRPTGPDRPRHAREAALQPQRRCGDRRPSPAWTTSATSRSASPDDRGARPHVELLSALPGFEVTPSRLELPPLPASPASPPATCTRSSLERGVLVRYFDTPLLQNHIRISAGRPDQTDALMAALA